MGCTNPNPREHGLEQTNADQEVTSLPAMPPDEGEVQYTQTNPDAEHDQAWKELQTNKTLNQVQQGECCSGIAGWNHMFAF